MAEKKVDIPDTLRRIMPDFISAGINTIESIFDKKAEKKEEWNVVERLEINFDNVFAVGNANSNFQGILIIGIMDSYVSVLSPHCDKKIELLDIFGEVGNCYCGVLMDKVSFTEIFGIMRQSVPQFAKGKIFIPKVWSVCGNIYFDNESWIHFGYAIREKTFY